MIYLGNQAVGVSLPNVGELTKHERITVTPNVQSQLVVNHGLGVAPKLVIADTTATVSDNNIKHVVSDQYAAGAITGNGSTQGYRPYVDSTGTIGNGSINLTSTEVHIHQASSVRTFVTTAEYTVDIYA